jgi:uncharacterized membrane protein YfhO
MRYRLQKNYENVIDLFDNLFNLETYSSSDTFFNWCVDVLIFISRNMGVTYEEANIAIFVIIHPLITLLLLSFIIRLKIKIKKLNKDY